MSVFDRFFEWLEKLASAERTDNDSNDSSDDEEETPEITVDVMEALLFEALKDAEVSIQVTRGVTESRFIDTDDSWNPIEEPGKYEKDAFTRHEVIGIASMPVTGVHELFTELEIPHWTDSTPNHAGRIEISRKHLRKWLKDLKDEFSHKNVSVRVRALEETLDEKGGWGLAGDRYRFDTPLWPYLVKMYLVTGETFRFRVNKTLYPTTYHTSILTESELIQPDT